MADPTTAIDRARETYKKLGRSEKWIQQRFFIQQLKIYQLLKDLYKKN